ncbi:MAG: aminotransferase class IV [Deltaproteobacteria bacterium]|jgi:4-amino-4-deoxychorismate lyase|nr:aminotransferase class IV [Deltaproteobacteria bacterium]
MKFKTRKLIRGLDPPKIATQFYEIIRLKNGKYRDVEAHQARMRSAYREILGQEMDFKLADILPEPPGRGLYRARVEYPGESFNGGRSLPTIAFSGYAHPYLRSLEIVERNDLRYPHKFVKRGRLNSLAEYSRNDGVIVTRGGYVMGATTANLVFQSSEGLFTPTTYLLPGVKRATLLEEGVIRERVVTIKDVASYDKIYLINSMIDLEDLIFVQTNRVFYEDEPIRVDRRFGPAPLKWTWDGRGHRLPKRKFEDGVPPPEVRELLTKVKCLGDDPRPGFTRRAPESHPNHWDPLPR